jgi:hypothetical protein
MTLASSRWCRSSTNPGLTHPYGESELMDAIPLVDAINKLATDMMVSAEYHAMPRRWATGIDMGDGEGSTERSKEKLRQEWTKAEAGRYNVAEDPNARFGQFQEASLKNFVDGIEMLAAQLAALCGLPPHYVGLMSQANPASADAIRSAEASLVQRVMRKQRVFGGSWERVMRLALLVKNGTVPSSAQAMETIWRDPKTPSVAQMVDAAVKLAQAGMPFRQTLEDTGRTPTEVDRIIEIRQTDTVDEALALAKGVDRLVEETGISRAAALALLGANDAAKYEAIVEARAPGPGVTNDVELAAEVAAATPVVPVGWAGWCAAAVEGCRQGPSCACRMTGDYCLDADRVDAYEAYSPSVFVISHEPVESEGPSLPFGFVSRDTICHTVDTGHEPWMWW